MKIGIVTVYRGSNYGAFLQAFALQSYLQECGNDVWFIRHHARAPFLSGCKKVITSMLHGKFSEIPFWITQENKMRRARKRLKEISRKDIGNLDVIILGSDEIWNMKRKKIYKYPIFWGEGIRHENKISYAPSVNMASIEDFTKNPGQIKTLKELKQISVRDEYSKNIIEQVTDKDVQVVLDPTLLISREFYRKCMEPVRIENPFILVYSYGTNKIDRRIIANMVQYARDKNLMLVSVMGYADWCDYHIGASPFEVLTYFDKAEFIITDTFHGTLFSLIFEKDFIVPAITSRKLDEVLRLFHVKERVIQKPDEMEKIISEHIDYGLMHSVLGEKIKESTAFLDGVLKNDFGRK